MTRGLVTWWRQGLRETVWSTSWNLNSAARREVVGREFGGRTGEATLGNAGQGNAGQVSAGDTARGRLRQG
ncbi:unnamed protein product [Lampetra planeri]